MPLVAQIARSIARRVPPSIDVRDLEATGFVALIGAAARYRPEEHGGAPFTAYARQVIRGAILEGVRQPSAEHSGRNWRAATHAALEDAPEPSVVYELHGIEARQRLARIAEASRWLTGLQRSILAAHYGPDEKTLAAIASELGISNAWACVQHNRAILTLRRRCAGEKPAARRLAVMASKPKLLVLSAAARADAIERAEVDELGALEKEFAPLRPKLARIELLRKSVRARYDASPAAETFEAKGERFVVTVGPRANESVINHGRLMKAIGPKLFGAIARVTLKALEEHCNCSVRAQVVTVEPIGPRPLKTYERGTPELPKAA